MDLPCGVYVLRLLVHESVVCIEAVDDDPRRIHIDGIGARRANQRRGAIFPRPT